MKYEVIFGRRIFEVIVEKSANRQLSITVHPDKSITAKAPGHFSHSFVQRQLDKKSRWIARQVDFFEQFHPIQPPRQYVSGETHYYLGRQYRLRIRQGPKSQVKLKGAFFEVDVNLSKTDQQAPQKASAKIAQRLMQNWYKEHARTLLTGRIEIAWPRFKRFNLEYPRVVFRKMHKRWGSCSGSGVIVLNTELVKAPVNSIDYVVIHELCHLVFPDHDSRFFRLLSRLMPDWQQRKQRLEKTQI